jgi:inositol transport system permease protein
MANPGVITADKAEKQQRMGHQISGVFNKYGIFLIFGVMVVVASCLSPAFLSPINLINIVRQMSIVGLIALGVTGIIVSGGIDLSSGSVVGLTAVVAASLAQSPDNSGAFYPGLHLPLLVPVVAACAVGALVGLINGSLVAKARIPPFIATLGTFTAIRGAANLYTSGRPISDLTDAYDFIGQGDVFGAPVPILILLVMAAVTHVLYAHTKFGKYIYAIGGNEQAARVSGINASRIKCSSTSMPRSWRDSLGWWFQLALVQDNRVWAWATNWMPSRLQSSVAPLFRPVESGQWPARLWVRSLSAS